MTCFCDSDASAAAANDDSASVPRGRRTQPIAAAEILAAAVQRDVIMSWITSSYDVIMRWRSWWRHHMTAATCHEVYVKLIATWRVHLTVVMRQTFQGWRQSRTPYTVKVVVYQKWCKIDPLLLHTTNRKCHMAYRFMPFPVTLNDLEGCKAYAIRWTVCNISQGFNWHSALRGPSTTAELFYFTFSCTLEGWVDLGIAVKMRSLC